MSFTDTSSASTSARVRIASAPPIIKGLVNLRGVIVPIVDIEMLMSGADSVLVDRGPTAQWPPRHPSRFLPQFSIAAFTP